MAHPEDPPYLTVGTEVSAKYRGAFCEATIKIAERLVKCKVSYGKGQSTVITSDFIKGPLKVGAQVDVKQSDGQVIAATLLKVTDNSTYTVVFDDGDERTLKRSSLCLKGGRHFHESESLDSLPLTDPENFGTPVNANLKKSGRRRKLTSQSPPWEVTAKKNYRCPSQFTVGKAVFLENDRRRSSWLPAVVVPTHYVLEPSEMTPETICLRSFKDGRYHVATENELHEFSPDKEPLLSMLEGEIQAMYMCKPAIERAMAYLDTRELPWDMDIFNQHPPTSIARVSELSTSDGDQHHRKDEDDSSESNDFQLRLKHFHETRGTPIVRHPTIGQRDLNLFHLYQRVTSIGGMERVTQEMKWCSVHLQMGLPPNSAASHGLRQAYKKYLYQFELYEKNKSKVAAKEGGKWASASERGNKIPSYATEEERDQPQTPALGGRRGGGGGEPVTRVNGMEKGKRGPPTETPVATKRVKVLRPSKAKELVTKQPSPDMETEEEEEDKNCMSDSKSEASDFEPPTSGACTAVDRDWSMDRSSSASNLDRGIQRAGFGDGLEKCPDGYLENDRVLVLYGKVKTQRLYEAKVVDMEHCGGKRDYLVHYSGWNNRYNEWIESSRIMGKIVGPIKARPHFNKRKKMLKNGSTEDLFALSLLPPGSPSPATTPLPRSSQSHSQSSSQPHTPLPSQPVLKPVLSAKKEAIDRIPSSNSTTSKKISSKKTTVRPSTCSSSAASTSSSSSSASSSSPSAETGTAVVGDGVRVSRTRGGKLDHSRSKQTTCGGGGISIDESRSSHSSPTPPLSELEQHNEDSCEEHHPATPPATVRPQLPATELQTPTIKPLTYVKSETSGVPQTPVTKLQPPVQKPQNPVEKPQNSVAKPQTPVVKPQTLVAKPQTPVTKLQTPVATPQTPIALSLTPVATPLTPVVPPLTPVVPPLTPVAPPLTPIEKLQTPIAKAEAPVMKLQTPVAKSETPVMKLQTPVTKSQTPVSTLQSPVKPQTPVTISQASVTKFPTPVKPLPSVTKSQASVTEFQPPVENRMPLVVSPATTHSNRTVSPPPTLPIPSSNLPLLPSSILICSERLPSLVMKQPPLPSQTPTDNNTTLSEPAQSLLSLAMISPISSYSSTSSTPQPSHLLPSPFHPSPSNHVSPLANVPRHAKSSPQSPPTCRTRLTSPPSPPSPLPNNSISFDPIRKEEDDHEEAEEDREGEEEGMSDDEEMEEDEQSSQQKTSSHIISSDLQVGSSLADAKACLDAVLECVEQRSLDSLSASDKEGSPEPGEKVRPSSFNLHKQLSISSSSLSPDGKRKWREYESTEEYEERKKARHSSMNYLLNFGDLPAMSSMERISLIQERLQNVKRRWNDLKNEVAYIERKRKRAKRKGKVAPSQALETSPSPPSSQQRQQLHTTITCH